MAFCLGFALGPSAPMATAQAKSVTTTTLALTSGGTPVTSATAGSPVTLTATVNAGAAAVTAGQVDFCDASAKSCTDIHLLGIAQLTSAGTATLELRPGIGSHSYNALFVGTVAYSSSTSSASALTVTGTIGPFASTTTIAESGSWGAYTLSAVTTEIGGTAAPGGTISFLDTSNGNAVIGTGMLGAASPGVTWLPLQSSASTGYPGFATATGDFNRDGIPDLAVLNQGTGVVIYLGNGDGTFTAQSSIPATGSYPRGIVVGDFNDDGIQDLAVVNNSGNNVTILLGNGDGTFTPTASSPATGSFPTAIAIGDFNGDGIEDLAVTNNSNVSGPGSLTVLLGNGDGTFAAVSTSPATGGSPSAIVAGDFNHDGKADLAITNEFDSTLTILLGNGDGTFTAAASPAVTTYAEVLATADFNGDGILDLIVACSNGGLVKVLLGNGDGTFTAGPAFPAAVDGAVGIAVVDFNQDGIPDTAILSNTYGGGVEVFLGSGGGGFAQVPVPTVPILGSATLLAVGDFNEDGRPDFAFMNDNTQKLWAFITQPTETATTSSSVQLANAGLHQVAASYGGSSNYNPSVSGTTPLWGLPPTTTTSLMLTSRGSQVTTVTPGTVITFTATVGAAGIPVTNGQVAFCDAAAVSCTDIHRLATVALTSAGTATFNFVPGPGSHSYKAMFVQDGYGLTSSSNVATVTVGPAKSPVYSDTTTITKVNGGTGDYSLTATVIGYGGTAPPTGTVAFLDTTFGNTSLATAQLGASTGGLGWTLSQTPALSNPPIRELEGDFNGDGIPDLALLWISNGAPGGITILFGNGDGTFRTGPTTQASVAVQGTDLYMTAGDFNGDGKLDLILLSYSSQVDYVTAFLGNGDGTFAVSATSTVFNQGVVGGDVISGSLVAADFNGDGKLDLAVAGDYVNSGGVTILLGNGDGTFNAVTPNFAADHGFQQIATGDFNGDGIPDLVAANYFDPGGATILLGKGDGTFSVLPTQLPVDRFPTSIVVGDFNGDGKSDLAFGYDTELMVFLGNGDGTFNQAPGSPLFAGIEQVSMVAGDFNHDGKIDLAALDTYADVIDLFIGVGDGTFTFTTTTPVVSPNYLGPTAIVASDFNGDGIPDLAMLDKNVTSAAILLAEPTQTATVTINGLAPIGPGTHNVEASYSGDSNYSPTTSATVALNAGLEPLVISPSGGLFSSTPTVTITEPVPGATIYYSLTGPVSTNGYVPYTAPIPLTLGGVEILSAYATETGYQQSSFALAIYTLNLPLAPQPTLSLTSGSFSSPQTVTISDTAPGATIYYTTDGRTPTTNSAIYTGPITVSNSETLAAIATASGYRPSAVASAQYFLNSSPSSFVYTIAGAGLWGYSGDGGLATFASLNYPAATVVDKSGNIYVADADNQVVRKIVAATGTITTIAGTGIKGYSGDNGPAVSAQLSFPDAVVLDAAGNLYIAEQGNRVVRMVAASTGIITTYAGSPTATSLGDGGPAISAQLSNPNGLAIDNTGNLYISDLRRIREVTASTGIISTVAGNGNYGYAGDNGPAINASFATTEGIAFDANGNLYVADAIGVIRKITTSTGIITTVAGAVPPPGSPLYGGDGGPALNAQLNRPGAIALDTAGNLFIADTENNAVREVTASNGIINSIIGHPPSSCSGTAGDGGPAIDSAICHPTGLSFDNAGNLLVAEISANRIRKITLPMLPPSAPTATPTFDIQPGTYAGPQTVHTSDATPGAQIYLTIDGASPIAAVNGYRGAISVSGSATLQVVAVAPGYLPSAPVTAVYTITTPPAAVINTVAGIGVSGESGAGGLATSAELAGPNGLAFDANGNLYIADSNNHAIWKVDASTGTISVVAGIPGEYGYSGDGGLATSAMLNTPSAIAFDKAGNLYIADTQNNLVRWVSTQTGIISTYAGMAGSSQGLGDGGPATSASLFYPLGLAFDSSGNLYIADSESGRIRMVSTSTGVITTVAGGGTGGVLGDGGAATSATLSFPSGVVVDPSGNLYVAEDGRVRFVNAATGVITSVAGNGDSGESGDGGVATAAEIYTAGLALDRAGNLYIANWPGVVRMVPAGGGAITTVAGNEYSMSEGDGGAATMARLSGPAGLAFDPAGNLYIADKGDHSVREVSFSGLPIATTPSFTLSPGSYVGTQTIAIEDATPGAVIYYTLDGTLPTMSATVNVYSGPFALSSSATLQAFAAAAGYTQSAVASASYDIKGPVAPTVTWTAPAAITYGTPLSSAQLNAATTVAGSFTYSPRAGTILSAGQHTLSATFTPTDTTDYSAVTANVTLTVHVATPSVSAVTSSLNPSLVTNSVTLTVNVTASAGNPGGTIAFMDGSAQLWSGNLNTGTVTYTTSALTAGSHSITAVYSGDPNFAPETSAPLNQIVESFTIATPSGGSSSATASAGGQASYLLLVNPPSVGAALTFSVSGLPAGASASFSPSSVPAGSTATTVTMTVSLPSTLAKQPIENPFTPGTLPFALGLVVLPYAGTHRKTSKRLLLIVLLALVAIAAVSVLNGCGGGGGSAPGGSNPQPSSRTYTLTVNANSGSLVQSTTLTLTVQ